jgi:hypothetical protein
VAVAAGQQGFLLDLCAPVTIFFDDSFSVAVSKRVGSELTTLKLLGPLKALIVDPSEHTRCMLQRIHGISRSF